MLIHVYTQSCDWVSCFPFSFSYTLLVVVFSSCHQIRMHESLTIFTTGNMLTVLTLLTKWVSCYFLILLVESLKIFIWAEVFQIMFSPWFNFVRKVQRLYIRIFLPLELVRKFFFLGCGQILMSFQILCIRACLWLLPPSWDCCPLLSWTWDTGHQMVLRATVSLTKRLARLANHCLQLFLISLCTTVFQAFVSQMEISGGEGRGQMARTSLVTQW